MVDQTGYKHVNVIQQAKPRLELLGDVYIWNIEKIFAKVVNLGEERVILGIATYKNGGLGGAQLRSTRAQQLRPRSPIPIPNWPLAVFLHG